MVPVDIALARMAEALCADDRFRATVLRHCPHLPPATPPTALKTMIHERDQMLAHSLRHHADANAAVSQYFNVAIQQYSAGQQLLRSFFRRVPEDLTVLDFACGYGRFLRFLCLAFPASRIWAAEIQDAAVDFVMSQFGVHGLRSRAEPAAFDPARRFDFIWVASLFSHLPEELFHGWLSRLVAMLSPRGVLCFSVHDERLLPPGAQLPESGLLFRAVSENPDLATGIYGTTYVNEGFVAGAIERAAGRGHPFVRIPNALAHEQDVYVVPCAREADLSGLTAFRRGAWGWVDERRIERSGRLYLRGWAASLDDGPIEGVEVRVDGRSHVCPTGLERVDVGQVFRDPRLVPSGWEWQHQLASGVHRVYVEVSAASVRQERALLYAGWLARPPGGDADLGRGLPVGA